MQLDKVHTQGLDQHINEFLSGSVLKAQHGVQLIRINVHRNALIAIVFSLLIHALILFFVVPKIKFDNASPPRVMEVSLALPEPVLAVVEPIHEAVQEKPATKLEKAKVIAQKTDKAAKPAFTVPEIIATPKPSPEVAATKQPAVKEAPVEEQYTDMASYVRAMQARRQGSEFDAARQNAEAVARERGPGEEQVREERIKRNFQNGTNGIFEITSLSSRNATFAFRGWTNDFSASKRQFFEVEAQAGQDVRLVMIKRMIALIREHYQGDFNWESHRLGHSVVQSARLEDNAGLEDFLMMEFFGTHYKNPP